MSKTFTTWVPRLPANSATPAHGVLAGHPALLVGGGPEREVGEAHQAVVGDDAVTGGEDALEVGAHAPVDADGSADAEFGSGSAARAVSGRTPTTTSTRSAKAVNSAPDDSTASIWKRPADPCGARAIALHGRVGPHVDAVRASARH